jgi:hypothetical protein
MSSYVVLILIGTAACEPVVTGRVAPGPQDSPAIESVDFERHVAPLITRVGCNAGSCHGSSEGKGGFKLSLFGYDKGIDYAAVMDADAGRVNLDEPSSSLLLEKPTLGVDHEGGLRLERDSWEYHVISRWIADGAPHTAGSANHCRIEITPKESVLTSADPTGSIRVFATFANGDRIDVTRLSSLRVQDETIASITGQGALQRIGTGDTAIIATYSGVPSNASILAPHEEAGASTEKTTREERLVDRFISTKLRRLNVQPAPLCSDETFLRRLSQLTIGQLPDPDLIRRFLADKSPDKRDRQIDAVLGDPRHAAMWATYLCEITGSGAFDGPMMPPDNAIERKWHGWLRTRFAQNMPYDQIVRGILTATTRQQQDVADFIQCSMSDENASTSESDYANRTSLDLFWHRPTVNEEIDAEAIGERVAAAFLGVRIECARCHKHPFDRWTQNDHRSFVNLFSQVRYGQSPALRAGLVDALEANRAHQREGKPVKRIPRMREVYLSPAFYDLRDTVTQEYLPARPLGGDVIAVDGDRREAFADWLTDANNPYFARNFVNRVWARCFGIGLVEPVDAFSAGNPSSHPELLDALAAQFVNHGFDVRRLERLILRSETWQRGTEFNSTNQSDTRNYARAYPRVPSAEVVVDAIRCAIGDSPSCAVEIGSIRAGFAFTDTYFEVFNRPERKLTCDCERNDEPSLRQAMLLLSDPELMKRVKQGNVARLASSELSNPQLVDELFLLTLSRFPDDDERAAALKHIDGQQDRVSLLGDVLWSLINTREFLLIH